MTQTTLITGATSGIGRELAFIAAEHKQNLILIARRGDVLLSLKKELEEKYHISVTTIVSDLSERNAAQKIITEIQKNNLSVDCLINNAGFGDYGSFEGTDDATNENMIQLNVITLTTLTRLLLPKMLEQKSGKILNVASTAAFQPGPFMTVYFATKAYVLSLSEALAEELHGSGVTVSVLCPGPTKTHFQDRAGTEKTELFKGAVMDARTVAETGYHGMMKNKRIIIPSWRNKILVQLLRVSPRTFTAKVMRKILQNSIKSGH